MVASSGHHRGAWGNGGSLWLLMLFSLFASCERRPTQSISHESASGDSVVCPNEPAASLPSDDARPRSDEYVFQRRQMVDSIRRYYDLTDDRVLAAMNAVPRHWFVPEGYRQQAYFDSPLPIGHGQTISQPFIVAYMTHLLEPNENKKVLEIGTGLGYQATVLSELAGQVYTIEIVKALGEQAAVIFQQRGYTNIHAKIGDGYKGWPEAAPFDGIIVTCAPDHIPPDLIEQLKPGGIMVIPVGGLYSVQDLVVITKDQAGNLTKESKLPVRFVPLTREKTE